jgi:archaeal flagellar protein FlaJ
MISINSLLRRNAKASSKAAISRAKLEKPARFFGREPVAFDLVTQLTYMSAIATAGISRAQLFEHTSNLSYSTSILFRRIHWAAQHLNYDYAQACEAVAETLADENMRSLLLRFASALSSGEGEAPFLAREMEVQLELYGKSYERDLETLQRWTDAYVALMVSAALIVVISLVSMMIYSMGAGLIVGLAVVVIGVTFFGSWIVYSVAPLEVKACTLADYSHERHFAALLARYVLPLGLAASAGVMLLGFGLPVAFITISIFMLPIGLLAMREDLQIDRRDRDISSVLRAIGSMVAAMGSTVGEGLARLNRRSLGSLEPQVKRLHVRLRSGLRSDLSWTRFAAESGSEMVTRAVRIFWDGLRLGGDAERISYLASMFAMKVSLLRASRKLVSSTFTFIMIPLHVALLSILLFVTEVLVVFGSKMVEVQSQGLDQGVAQEAGVSTTLLFAAPDMAFIRAFIVAVILILTAANTFAPYAASGGHVYKLCLYGSVMCFLSGLAMLVIPWIVQGLFASIAAPI